MGIEENDYVGAQEAIAGALSIAEREHDTTLEMGTLAYAARINRSNQNLRQALQNSLQAIKLARRLDDTLVEVAAHYEASILLVEQGNLEQALQHAAAMLEGTERLRDRYWLSSALNFNGALCFVKGDWPTARDFSERGLEVSPEDSRNLGIRAVWEYQIGDFNQGSIHLERLIEVMHLAQPGPSIAYGIPAQSIALIALITGLQDQLEVAEVAAQTVLSTPNEHTPQSIMP